MRSHWALDGVRGTLNFISGGVLGDAVGQSLPRKVAPVALPPERPGVRTRKSGGPGERVRGEVGPDAQTATAANRLRSLVFDSLKRYQKVPWWPVVMRIACGLVGGIVFAAVLFPALYYLCSRACVYFGKEGLTEPVLLTISGIWLLWIVWVRGRLKDYTVGLTGRGDKEHLRLGRIRSVADPKSAQFIAFLLISPVGAHVALLHLAPGFFFGTPAEFPAWQQILTAVDNVCGGFIGSVAGLNTGFSQAWSRLLPEGLALFLVLRVLTGGLWLAFLWWWRHHLITMRGFYREFPSDASGLEEWIQKVSNEDRYFHLFSNEIMFLVTASKGMKCDFAGAQAMLQSFGGMAVRPPVRKKLMGPWRCVPQ